MPAKAIDGPQRNDIKSRVIVTARQRTKSHQKQAYNVLLVNNPTMGTVIVVYFPGGFQRGKSHF
jgi:hypothetical protein